MGYSRAGFDVVGVDINPQPNYPFEFHQADAMDWPLDGFDAAHASPPCQRYSTITGKSRDDHPDLVAPVRDMLNAAGLPWVIENVPQAPLIDPVTLCGSAFGLRVRRHRAFESNMPIAGTACHHGEQGRPVGVYGQHPDRKQHLRPDGTQRGTKATSVGHARRSMGIWWMTWPELAESIPPAFTEWVGRQLLSALSTGASTRPGSSRAHTLGNAASLDRKTGFPLNMGALADSAPCVRSPRSGCAGIGACSLESSRVQDDPA